MLRHMVGLLVGLVVAPLLWVGAAWSAAEITGHLQAQRFSDPMLLTACAVMMGVGVACGVLAGTRVSPLAAFVAGGLVLGASLWPLLSYDTMAAAVPDWLAEPGTLFHPMGPGLPLHLALGTLLFISSLPFSRWRPPLRREDALPAYPPAPAPAPAPPSVDPYDAGRTGDDPGRTTTPFRRDGEGFQPLAPDGTDHTRTFRDDG
ncbi:hypothetical protein [Actinorugispora endophytica]|uniref:Uncharacterized protein n=1 Tax=Actinorugispora endophytica TaxID=1605990 RepID=A0A4V3D8J3_9ACTN|nr:hypothetical protein [Actinorugispora endophytica]TDQ51907.1 hypothetical protein EV190_10917 [Actinorugispora endophytica]